MRQNASAAEAPLTALPRLSGFRKSCAGNKGKRKIGKERGAEKGGDGRTNESGREKAR